MLIPLPIDMNISMINIFRDQFQINIVPTILINEKIKLEDIKSYEEIDKIINSTSFNSD